MFFVTKHRCEETTEIFLILFQSLEISLLFCLVPVQHCRSWWLSFHRLHWDLDLVFNSSTKLIFFSTFKYVSELFCFKIHYDLLFGLHGFCVFLNTVFIFCQLLLVKFKPPCSLLPMCSLSLSFSELCFHSANNKLLIISLYGALVLGFTLQKDVCSYQANSNTSFNFSKTSILCLFASKHWKFLLLK